MENIQLSFESKIPGANKMLTVEVPYSDSMVATSRYCPEELLNGDIKLLAALNGQPLDNFIADCKNQLMAAAATEDAANILDAHIAGLVASAMAHYSCRQRLSLNDILLHVDVFSHLLAAEGVGDDEVKRMYPEIVRSIQSLVENKKQ